MNFDNCDSYKSNWNYDTKGNTFDAKTMTEKQQRINNGVQNVDNLASLNWRFWQMNHKP